MISTILCLPFIWLPFVSHTSTKKHIVFGLFDDLGWSDISAQNGEFPTPKLDASYANGIVLERHYIHYLCSPSRSQFLTGRRAFNLGYGQMKPWGYTQIGAIPPGQPVVANWFRDFPAENTGSSIPTYATYGIGKWHVGYASSYNTPFFNGFDHYYGFYQSGIDYKDKTHPKADYWQDIEPQFDFFEDEVPAYPALNVTTNTMDLYLVKIEEYLQHFTNNHADDNLFLYLGIQTLHGPLTRIARYTDECKNIFKAAGEDEPYDNSRLRTCEFTRMSDDWYQDVIDLLVQYGLWDDTLLVVTGDNGADIEMGACNYPLRGTKSTFFEGNIRQLTWIDGGDNIIPTAQRGTTRSSLISNLDWVPTLLSYAGILPYIANSDKEWDGDDQWDMIINGDSNAAYDYLLLSIQSDDILNADDIDSYSILYNFPKDDRLYKYVLADVSVGGGDDYNWVKMRNDGWCTYNGNGSMRNIDVADSAYVGFAEIEKKQFLFDLDNDEGETHNLMKGTRVNGNTISDALINARIRRAKKLLTTEINKAKNKNFYNYPISCFWDYWSEGAPINFTYTSPVFGYYIMPFFSDSEWITHITACLDETEAAGQVISNQFRNLYLNEWQVPTAQTISKQQQQLNVVQSVVREQQPNGHHLEMVVISIIAMIVICVSLTCAICYKSKAIRGKEGLQINDEYTPLMF